MYNSPMSQFTLFKRAFLLLVSIGILYYFAEVFYLHWTIWWYDVMLHFLSGACASMAFIYFYFKYFKFTEDSKIKAIHLSFFFVFFVGVVWEIYEIQFDHTSFTDGMYYVRDTLSDVIIDLCGGFFGTLYSFRFIGKTNDRILTNGK